MPTTDYKHTIITKWYRKASNWRQEKSLHHANNIEYIHSSIESCCGTPLFCAITGLEALLKLELNVGLVDEVVEVMTRNHGLTDTHNAIQNPIMQYKIRES